MADEQYQWLDRDAAERLLRGEPLEGVDPHVRAQADRLARALGALAADDRATAPGTDGSAAAPQDGTQRAAREQEQGHGQGHGQSYEQGRPQHHAQELAHGELPGEAAALAAFRAAGPGSARAATRSAAYATPAHEAAAGETVRLGRAGERPQPSRWGRPVRFGLAAALAACMVGGVAVAAGTGVLPSPFGRHGDSGPAASASPVATPETSLPTPSDDAGTPSEDLNPDASSAPDQEPTREAESSSPPEAEAGGDTQGPTRRPDRTEKPQGDKTKNWYRKAVAACRAYRSGELQGEKRRRLEEAAKGRARVEEFCGRVLGGAGGGGNGGANAGAGNGKGNGGGDDGDDGDDGGSSGGGGEDGGDDGGSSGGDTGGNPGPPPSTPSVPGTTPTASYRALPVLP
ncbi:hypothetical protein [Streptomyces kanamyceticus]|uniref:Extensin n=1 Tax=Streptomyces kanamyceticus TaxID=1967 RepID=A0A5J6GB31_STRKN|nr:hypothetical protein [Streptomyces kanamyceticus]QEU92273.1 hypothetical protein CP970_16365 [Streptomyces kanamyceticus]